jgi:UDP-glucuronate 4-epimerase
LAQGLSVIGVDNLNAYYEVSLKESRLAFLRDRPGFRFRRLDIADRRAVSELADAAPEITHIVHLAAQAGVRYSLVDPYAYVDSNVMGHLVISEFARRCPKLLHFVYASSSSVYGGNRKLPFSVADAVDSPNSLYAASKRADELIARTYAHLHDLPSTGLRLFTVYGPWGRPDMAYFLFTKAIFEGTPITVFNDGEMWRDFTFIDDIVDGVLRAVARPPTDAVPPHRLYNLGNQHPEKLTDLIAILERAIGRPARIVHAPMQPGDVASTCADIESSQRDLGFEPRIRIEEGLPRFVEWYRGHYRMATT